ncbi:unnamed protein product [Urochloa decumbens]|uniref:Uncharacterized protein n=1 Tax=Urochloa decumbens TaxID=240449 RepID=A0ABC8ZD10_9POAL
MASTTSTTTTTSSAHSLKLFIETNARRVLFAEASRDAVSFLHALLDSHLASLRFDDATGHGCIGNIYDSADALANAAAARACTCPRCSPPLAAQQQQQVGAAAERFFVCGAGCGGFVTDRSGAACPSCGAPMAAELPCGAPGAGGSSGGQHQKQGEAAVGMVVCILKDDLAVEPAPGAFLELLSGVFREAAAFQLQVATVRLGHKEGLEILEASLRSSTVLTDVFLRDKAVALEFDRTSPSSLGLGRL